MIQTALRKAQHGLGPSMGWVGLGWVGLGWVGSNFPAHVMGWVGLG
jgi:hypothetical protein